MEIVIGLIARSVRALIKETATVSILHASVSSFMRNDRGPMGVVDPKHAGHANLDED